ncbi:MAG: hypothetical protein MJZ86_03940 [Bacteroidales bacterium]|nr:hypothetical protein [Bacteroidales bacterium]
MALVDCDIPMRGSVGQMTFKHYADKVVVCQKIGKRTKSLSEAQARDNYRMRNAMAMFGQLKEGLLEHLEGCPDLRRASNWYVRYNKYRNESYLTKQEVKWKACVVEGHQVSHGTLAEIDQHLTPDGRLFTDIRIDGEIDAQTTVGELSADILAHNPAFALGDRLDLVYLHQQIDADEMPRAQYRETQMTLNRHDARLLGTLTADIPWVRHEVGGQGVLALARPLGRDASCFVQVRHSRSGRHQVSSQRMLCENDLVEHYRWEVRKELMMG